MAVAEQTLQLLQQLSPRVQQVMLVDRQRLWRRLQQLRELANGRSGRTVDPERFVYDVMELQDELVKAELRLADRFSFVPKIVYPDDLPVSQRREEIKKAIQEQQVVVLCGETGSGKTTQLPKICLELGRGVRGLIGHTQPRRIAARSVAKRISDELGSRLGELVGFKVRFGDETSPRNLIKLMTDGILLAETQTDRFLNQYDTLIIDEAHERSLNIDFMLGYLKTLLPKRPDLKVIVTSATIDPERFARHFSTRDASGTLQECPIISVSGRTYPVETRYRPPVSDDLDERDEEFQHHIVQAVDELCTEGAGDILIFLSGEREIRETAETLENHRDPSGGRTHVLPLYAKLTAEEQSRVFEPHDGRRIVLATNVAETSLTVPGIRYVIDPGYARINRYSPKTKVQRLEIESISRASADQRKGRCGRLGPGICIRLYSEKDFADRTAFTDPEIARDNLASVILQMAALHLGKVEDFPFVEAPDSRAVKDGYETLQELGAIDDRYQLTPIGRDLAKLPIDPRIGRMILAAGREGALAEVLVIASALAIQDPRERPMALADKADEAHEQFDDAAGDFISYLNLWHAWRENKRQLSGSRLRRWCKESFVSFVRMREWEDVHAQLAELANELRLRINRNKATPDSIHRSLLTGLLCNIGQKPEKLDAADREKGNYLGGRSNRFSIFPGSSLFQAGPKWLMAAEIVHTTKVYARTVAPVTPEWIEELGAHLLKRTYSEPRWDKHAGKVVANERVMIFGIELVPKRRISYGAIAPDVCRQIFVHHGLVLGELERLPAFLEHNLDLEDRVKELEVRTRRNNLVANTDKRFAFYDARVPKDILAAATFEKWRHEQAKKDSRLLFMSLEDLLSDDAGLPTESAYPDEVDVGPFKLPLSYVLDPSHELDGITVHVPLDALGQVQPERFAWLIPGHLREKVETILRGLSKDWRRLLPPASQLAEQVLPMLKFGEGVFVDQLRAAILKATTIDVPKDVIASVPTPLWMCMRFEIEGEEGQVLAAGRDLNQLKALLAPKLKAGMLTSPNRYNRDGIKHWDFGDLPERVEVDRGGVRFGAFPGIVDSKTNVSLRLFDTFESAQAATRHGTRRLFMFSATEVIRRHCTYIPGVETAAMLFGQLGSPTQFREGVAELIADRAFIGDMLPVRTEKEFAFRVSRGIERMGAATQEVAPLLTNLMQLYHAAARELSAKQPPAFEPVIGDMRDQLARLMRSDFMVATPFEWLRHYPRYFQAIRVRLSRLPGGGVAKDQKQFAEIAPLLRGYEELARRQKELGLNPQKVEEFRWLLEELRVQLFAQDLRTAVPVSSKRLMELWHQIVKQ
jgi:ATP-dependent helicase HrpA